MASAFEAAIRLHLKRYGAEEAKRRHVAIARQTITDFLVRQDTPPDVRLEVDGRPATSEEEVKPFGVITYRLSRVREMLRFARAEAMEQSPVDTGLYQESWIVLADGQTDITPEIEMNLAGDVLSVSREYILTNFQPYSRKINLGLRGYEGYAPPGVVELVKQSVLHRYRQIVTAKVAYLLLDTGVAPAARKNARPTTYPSLILTPKFW